MSQSPETLEVALNQSQDLSRTSPPPFQDGNVPISLKNEGQNDEIPRDTANPATWSLDRVLAWLITKNFSEEWQNTFESLKISGETFLELGGGHGGRGNFGMMYIQVYPHLAEACTKSGTGWDQAREREEGKRLRRAIRRLVTEKTDEAPVI
jgi:mitogen-activated protein kinase kinase kinase